MEFIINFHLDWIIFFFTLIIVSRPLRTTIDVIQGEIEQCKKKILREHECWKEYSYSPPLEEVTMGISRLIATIFDIDKKTIKIKGVQFRKENGERTVYNFHTPIEELVTDTPFDKKCIFFVNRFKSRYFSFLTYFFDNYLYVWSYGFTVQLEGKTVLPQKNVYMRQDWMGKFRFRKLLLFWLILGFFWFVLGLPILKGVVVRFNWSEMYIFISSNWQPLKFLSFLLIITVCKILAMKKERQLFKQRLELLKEYHLEPPLI